MSRQTTDTRRSLLFDAVVFDLDGVLFDTEPIHRAAWLEVMGTLGHDIEEESLMKWTGIPCRDLAEHFSRTLQPSLSWEEYYRIKTVALRRIAAERLAAFDGVAEALTELSRFVAIGFATSNYRDDAGFLLRAARLEKFFRDGVTYDDVQRHKPDPEPYLTVAALMNTPPSRCIAIEDSPTGVASAAAAGMSVLGVTTTFGCESLEGAERCFSATAEACAWLMEMRKQRD